MAFESPWGHKQNSRTESGCFALIDQADPSSLWEVRLKEFLAMLLFEQRNKLAELAFLENIGEERYAVRAELGR
jgi:hypothetical protein